LCMLQSWREYRHLPSMYVVFYNKMLVEVRVALSLSHPSALSGLAAKE
jgi:hypothetical protein